MIKVISFNVDGEVMDKTQFDNLFWYEELPLEYSRINKISIEKSKATVEEAYRSRSLFDPDWHKPEVWFAALKMHPDEERMVKNLSATYVPFRDAKAVLEALYNTHTFKLVAVSNNSKNFLRFKFKAAGVQGCFHQVYSAVDSQSKVKIDPSVFREILKAYRVSPEEMVHVGTDLHIDYDVPRALGIHAVRLDRKATPNYDGTISSLTQLKSKIDGFNKVH